MLWPWVAASVAIHGLVFWPVEGDKPSAEGSEHVVEIALSAEHSLKSVNEEKRLHSSHRPVHKKRVESPIKGDERSVEQPTEIAATSMMVPQTASQGSPLSEVSKQESLVRNHLERFKYYPASARRRGIVGEVEVAFELTSRGQANILKVLTASGYRVLDEAALDAVRRAVPFPVESGTFHFRLLFRTSS